MRLLILFLLCSGLSYATHCAAMERSFEKTENEYLKRFTVKDPIRKYAILQRYIEEGSALMAHCRAERHKYPYKEIVQKLREADRERAESEPDVIDAYRHIGNPDFP